LFDNITTDVTGTVGTLTRFILFRTRSGGGILWIL